MGRHKGFKHTEEHNKKISKIMKDRGIHTGKDNPSWKGGKSRKYSYTLKKQMLQVCNRCGTEERLVIHHKDNNPTNNNHTNLEILCGYCHRIHHYDHLIPFQYKKGDNHIIRAKKVVGLI